MSDYWKNGRSGIGNNKNTFMGGNSSLNGGFFNQRSNANNIMGRNSYERGNYLNKQSYGGYQPQTMKEGSILGGMKNYKDRNTEGTMQIFFDKSSAKIKEHESAKLVSIMFSSELLNSRHSLMHLRCQDYMQMCTNSNNCIKGLSDELENALKHNHINADILGKSSGSVSMMGGTMNRVGGNNQMERGTGKGSFFNRGNQNNFGMNNSNVRNSNNLGQGMSSGTNFFKNTGTTNNFLNSNKEGSNPSFFNNRGTSNFIILK